MKLYVVTRRSGEFRSVTAFDVSEIQEATQALSDLRGALCEATIVADFGFEDAMVAHPDWFAEEARPW